MIDLTADVGSTFNDYQEDSDISFIKLRIDAGHALVRGKHLLICSFQLICWLL